ncbi:MAG: plasmid recombination protein [Acutalibacteraceae bacterium]|nr:plasmid recombination protein [Acutalibacteraceae bacterium]
MARNDGVDRVTARNVNLADTKIANVQRHNEREKESYVNSEIVTEMTPFNVHYKKPNDTYENIFNKMVEDKIISTRGLKADAKKYGELIFDVNSAYFFNHGGYEFAKKFYEDTYKAAIEIVGGEEYIISAVMHADERNKAMSEALGQDVYHYHLHVVYVPVVEKEILWSKRCKDENLRGTVKEKIMQVSSSKKWISKPALDENGNPVLQKNGKPVLKKSYSVLQDDFYNYMRNAGYDDVERGERGSSEEHLTVTQFKVMKEAEKLEALEEKFEKSESEYQSLVDKTKVRKTVKKGFDEIEEIGKTNFFGKVEMTQDDCTYLKERAKMSMIQETQITDLKNKLSSAKKDIGIWKKRYEALYEQTKEFLEAVKRAPEKIKAFIQQIIHSEKNISQPEHKNRNNLHKI